MTPYGSLLVPIDPDKFLWVLMCPYGSFSVLIGFFRS